MDITTTSNLFLLLAEGMCRRGDDMEDVARALSKAFKAAAAEGLGTDNKLSIISEFVRLGDFG